MIFQTFDNKDFCYNEVSLLVYYNDLGLIGSVLQGYRAVITMS